MLERLRSQIGTAGLIVAIVALVAALGGGAYAATGGPGGSKATASAKQGKPGKTGKTGPAGPAGPQGPAGPKGDTGAKGDPGAQGAAGPAGAAGLTGPQGPAGKNGTTGFTETLPEGKTLTGVWGSGSQTPQGRHTFQISFNIPLPGAPTPIVVQPNENSAPGCPGRGGGAFPASGEFKPTVPEADPGNLCVYLDKMEETAPVSSTSVKRTVYEEGAWFNEEGASQAGAFLEVICLKFCQAMGSWAVTAQE